MIDRRISFGRMEIEQRLDKKKLVCKRRNVAKRIAFQIVTQVTTGRCILQAGAKGSGEISHKVWAFVV